MPHLASDNVSTADLSHIPGERLNILFEVFKTPSRGPVCIGTKISLRCVIDDLSVRSIPNVKRRTHARLPEPYATTAPAHDTLLLE